MKLTHTHLKLSPIVIALSLSACGGGSSGGKDIAGIDGSGSPAYASGPITGFGSVLVNGHRFIVGNDTTVTLDGASGLQTQLKVGQYVTISSSTVDEDGNPIADIVRSDTLIEGPITNINLTTKTVTVLNQQIRINDNTIFDDDMVDQSLSGLALGDVIEVTGAQNNSGTVLATRIELDDENDESKLVGAISGLDQDAQQFTLNGFTVSYFGAELDDIPNNTLSDGDVVKVKGTINGDILEATEVEGFDDVFEGVDDDDEIEIKGPVTRFVSTDDFDVNGIRVRVNSETEYDDGTVDDIQLDAQMEVEGYWENGVLVAEELSFEQEENAAISGVIEGLAATNASLNEGSITVLGVVLTSNSLTSYEDESEVEVFDFGFDDLSLGNYVEIEGYFNDSNQFIVTELEREEVSDEVEIEGPLGAKNLPESITLLGKMIDTSNIDTSELTDVPLGTQISVEGMLVQGSLVIEEISVESDDD
ncbi:MAG: DUF5666 domain-containing protein [Oleiphilus sp.]